MTPRCYRSGLPIHMCGCVGCITTIAQAQSPMVMASSPYPKVQPPIVVAAKPVKPAWEELPVDLEVGRYALRTFKITPAGELASVFQTFTWENGAVVAECRTASARKCSSSPGPRCSCGIYGTLTLDHLYKQYPQEAQQCVAVIAAEGMTLIGDRGLRTAAARIVAYWTASTDTEEVFATTVPDAKNFDDMAEMLAAYKLPEYEKPFPPPQPEMIYLTTKGSLAVGTVGMTMDQLLASWMPSTTKTPNSAFTSGAIEAIKHALGFIAKPKGK